MYLDPEAVVTPIAPAPGIAPGRGRRALARLGGLRIVRPPGAHGPIGLDISQEHLNLVQFDTGGAAPSLRAVAALPLPVERDLLLADRRGFRRLLREALRSAAFRGRTVVTCMPPTQVRLSMLTYKCRSEGSDAAAVAEQARERLGADAADWLVDYLPVRTRGEGEGERAALLAAARFEHVLDYLELLRHAGLTVGALEVGPAAVARAVTASHNGHDEDNVLTVNFGRERSYLTVFSGRRLILDREIAFGENALVATVAVGLETERDEAHALLGRYGLGTTASHVALAVGEETGDDGIAATLSDILRARLLELRDEIGKAALYAASHTRGAGIRTVLLLGGVARWPHIAEALGALLDLPVAIMDPLSSLPASPSVQLPADVGVLAGLTGATGCALRGSTPRA